MVRRAGWAGSAARARAERWCPRRPVRIPLLEPARLRCRRCRPRARRSHTPCRPGPGRGHGSAGTQAGQGLPISPASDRCGRRASAPRPLRPCSHAVTVGADAKICRPSGNLMHFGSASSQEITVDVVITIFPCVAGTFVYPDLTKRSQDHDLVNVQAKNS